MSSEEGVPEVDNPMLAEPRSVIERIRAKKDKREQTLDMPIPAWNGSVIGRYRKLTPKQVADASRSDKSVIVNARVLAWACIEMLAVDPETGDVVPVAELLEDANPTPVRYDGRLADAFKVGGERPDQIVRKMFEDDLAVAHHAKRLLNWQTGEDLDRASEEDLEELAGEA